MWPRAKTIPFPSGMTPATTFHGDLTGLVGVPIWAFPILAATMLIWILSIWTGHNFTESRRASAPFLIGLYTLICRSGLYSLFPCFLVPTALTWYGKKRQLAVMLRIHELLRFIPHKLGMYVEAAIVSLVDLALCVGVAVSQYGATLVASHLF